MITREQLEELLGQKVYDWQWGLFQAVMMRTERRRRHYTEEELLDLTDAWHEGHQGGTLWGAFGWTHEEYKHWVETNEQPV